MFFIEILKISKKKKNVLFLFFDSYFFFIELFNSIIFSKKYIYIQFYIIRNDFVGIKFINILKKKSYFCFVYILVDKLGTKKFNINFFNKDFFSINYRNHKKLVLIDNNLIWIGGNNIGNEYLNYNLNYYYWEDFHVKILNFTKINNFLSDFYFTEKKFPIFFPIKKKISKNVILLNVNIILIKIILLKTKKIFWIFSPYIILDKYLINIFIFLLIKRVKINIVISKYTDNMFVHLCTIIFLFFFKKKINVYILINIFNHRKIYILDNKYIFFGSMNFDNRSIYLNFENIVLTSDKEFIFEFFKKINKKIINYIFFKIKKKIFLLKVFYLISFLNYLKL